MNNWTQKGEIEEWRKLHNDKPNSLCHSPNIFWVTKSRRLKRASCEARTEGARRVLKLLADKTIGNKPLGRPRDRWEDVGHIVISELIKCNKLIL